MRNGLLITFDLRPTPSDLVSYHYICADLGWEGGARSGSMEVNLTAMRSQTSLRHHYSYIMVPKVSQSSSSH